MALAKRTRKRKANTKLTLIGCQACARQSSRDWTWTNSPGPGNKSMRQHGSHPCSPDTDSEAGYLASIRGPWLRWERMCGLWVAVLIHTSPQGLPSVRRAGAGPWGSYLFLPILFEPLMPPLGIYPKAEIQRGGTFCVREGCSFCPSL